jgi:hypothetical protein
MDTVVRLLDRAIEIGRSRPGLRDRYPDWSEDQFIDFAASGLAVLSSVEQLVRRREVEQEVYGLLQAQAPGKDIDTVAGTLRILGGLNDRSFGALRTAIQEHGRGVRCWLLVKLDPQGVEVKLHYGIPGDMLPRLGFGNG